MFVSIVDLTTIEFFSISRPHCLIGPREETKPKLTITSSTSSTCFLSPLTSSSTICSMRSSPMSSVGTNGVTTLTFELCKFSTLCSCARNGLRRLHGLRPARARRVAAGAGAEPRAGGRQRGQRRAHDRRRRDRPRPRRARGAGAGPPAPDGGAGDGAAARTSSRCRSTAPPRWRWSPISTATPRKRMERCRFLLSRWEQSEDHHYAVWGLRLCRRRCSRRRGGPTRHTPAPTGLTRIATSSGHGDALAALAHGAGRDRARRRGAGARRRAARPRGRAAPRAADPGRAHADPAPRRGGAGRRRGARARVERQAEAYRLARKLAARPLAGRAAAAIEALGESAEQRLGRAAADGESPLTRRELEVVRLVADGPHQPRDRRRALPQPAHGRHARPQHPRQARLPLPGRGQHQGRRGRAAALSRTLIAGELTLDPLEPADAHELASLLDDRNLHEFIGGEPLTEPALEARYHRLVAGAPSGSGVTWLNWTIRRRADGQAVGTAQATVVDRDAALAWVVASKWQGRGYASDVARALVAWAEREGLTASASVHPRHTASERVASRAGLRPTGDWAADERVWRVPDPPDAECLNERTDPPTHSELDSILAARGIGASSTPISTAT